MTRLLEEMIAKIQQLPEADQNRIAVNVMGSIDALLKDMAKTSSTSLSEILLLPILEDDELDIFERDQDTGREVIL